MDRRETKGRAIIDTLRPRRVARVHHLMVQVVVDIDEAGWPVEERPQPVTKIFYPHDVNIARLVMEAERMEQQRLDAEAAGEE